VAGESRTVAGKLRPVAGELRARAAKTIAGVAVLAGIASAFFGYLAVADERDWPPWHNDDAALSLELPSSISPGRDLQVTVSGRRVGEGQFVWLVGKDEENVYYPFDEANWDGEKYIGEVRSEQIPDPSAVDLHLVLSNGGGHAELNDYIGNGDPKVGLPALPAGAESIQALDLL
jgi:hypothetical protein